MRGILVNKIAAAFGGILLVIGGLFLLIVASTLMGTLAGWVVGLFFSDAILGVLAQIGVHGITMVQFGTFMGFIGGFLKTKVTATVES